MDNNLAVPFLTRDMLAFQEGTAFTLQITAQSLTGVPITIRGITKEGSFTLKHTPSVDGSLTVETFRVPDIPILLSVIDALRAYKQNDCYVEISLLANGQQIASLCSGYVYNQHSISYPNTNNIDIRPTQGRLLDRFHADPAAGAEINYPMTFKTRVKPIGLTFTLTTSAAAANRRVHVRFLDVGDYPYADMVSDIDQTAGTTKTYWVNQNPAMPVRQVGNNIYIPMILGAMLEQQCSIVTVTDNLQAGDQFADPMIFGEEWYM